MDELISHEVQHCHSHPTETSRHFGHKNNKMMIQHNNSQDKLLFIGGPQNTHHCENIPAIYCHNQRKYGHHQNNSTQENMEHERT